MKVLAIIPARGGSKGVPRKNLRPLAGKPLICYTIEAAKDSGVLDTIIVSTDDHEIADVAIANGAAVPFLRPAEMASDASPMLDVVRHALSFYREKGEQFEAVALLQPTTPFRTAEHIRQAIDRFSGGNFDSLISVKEIPDKYNPYWAFVKDTDGTLKLFCGADQPVARRQDLPKAYIREGSIYLFLCSALQNFGNIYGKNIGYYEIKEPTVNIDTWQDFDEAEKFVKSI